jgi:hypothetical protein
MHRALERFLECLRERRYYDAHEVLEVLWFPRRFETNDEVRLMKGLINASVSFELIRRGRAHASGLPWKNYLKYRALLERLEGDAAPMFRRVCRQVERIHASASVMI